MKGLGSRGENANYTNEGKDSRIVVVGIQGMPGSEAIMNGTTEDVQLIGDGICAKMAQALKDEPAIKAILLECTMMGPYSNRLRETFGMPVFDCVTAADTVLRAHRRHDRLVCQPGTWTK